MIATPSAPLQTGSTPSGAAATNLALHNEHDLTGRLQEVALGYQQMLEQNPTLPVPLVGMSLVAIASNQPAAAVQMALAAVNVAPQMGNAWVALGQAYKSNGQHEQAEQAYRRALALDGMDPLAHMGLGELQIAMDQPGAAVRSYEMALRKNPVLVAAHLGLGHALACMSNFEAALDRYQQTLSIRPRLAEAEFAAGFALVRLGRPREAEVRYRKALALRPDFAAAWLNLGCLLREQGREVYAEAALLKSLQLRPDLIGAWINLGLLERDRKNLEKAEAHLQQAYALDHNRIDTQVAFCQLRAHQKDLPGAWEWIKKALVTDANNAEAVNMKGILLHTEGHFTEAVATFERAEELGNRAASSNRGNSLLDLGRVDEALKAHELAVERDPECAGARYNLAMTRLRTGDYQRGWPGYEARWEFREVHRLPRKFKQPRWQGEPLEGRTVLIHAEQGLGDSIQFCRYIPMVVARGGRVLLQLQSGVKRLLGSLAAVKAGQATIAQLGVKPPDFDLECPLMSLPAVFGTTVETVPWTGAYLGADPQIASATRLKFPYVRPIDRLRERPLRIGIAWAGNPGYKADKFRSTNLATFLPLLRIPGINWISLQKGEPAEQLNQLPGDLFVWDGASKDRDLADTAALIATLDLVISTDTCIAHLAGAMAKPVWILLPHLADWRWMREREDTPWYPTARLLRQSTQGDWSALIERVIGALSEFRAERWKPSSRWSKREFVEAWQIPA